MRNLSARLLLGATLLVAGFGVLGETSPLARAVAVFDMKDRQCRHAPTAVGAACPTGCEAVPLRSSDDRSAPTVCRSRAHIAVCGKDCAPQDGLARTDEGELIDGTRLVVALRGEPDEAFLAKLASLGVTLAPRFDGLYRYDASLAKGDVAAVRKRIAALPEVADIAYVMR